MREKVAEYLVELHSEIDRCALWLEEHMYGEACAVSAMEGRIHALSEVVSDLQSRLDGLV